MPRPFSPGMFPHTVTVPVTAYAKGATGGAIRSEAPGVTLRANVQLSSIDKMTPLDTGDIAGTETVYEVSFPASQVVDLVAVGPPTLKRDDSILWGGLTLECFGPAAPVFRGVAFRVRCVSRV